MATAMAWSPAPPAPARRSRLQILAEGFSNAGVPVFCADIKGDLSGIAMMGKAQDFLVKRAEQVKLDPYEFQEFPVIFWDLFGEQGHPIRATVSEMGPLLLSRLMNLSEAQEGIMNIAFRIADEEGLLLLDMKDLQALLANIAERADEIGSRYGNVTKPSVGAIQRTLLVLEQQGAAHFFGEPALRIADIMRTTRDGRGAISVLAADKLMMNPRLYATFLLWLMSELFEELPEVGDPDKPKLVFFFDEAHLLFDEAPKVLIDRVEQVVRLIRSKGVGVYFVTQNPLDIPETVLAQLGNRVQHALRAYTPREQKAVRTAADTFRPNPDFDCADRDHPARHRRGAGLDAGGQGRAVHGAADADPAAIVAAWPDHAGRAPQADRREPGRRPVRPDHRPRIGLRDAAEEGQGRAGGRRAGSSRPTAAARAGPFRASAMTIRRRSTSGGRRAPAPGRPTARRWPKPRSSRWCVRSARRSAARSCAGFWAACPGGGKKQSRTA